MCVTKYDIHSKPLQESLIHLRSQLAQLAQKPGGYTIDDVDAIQAKLRELDNSKYELFNSDPKGKALIEGLLDQLHEEIQDLKTSINSVSETLVPIVERLKQIRYQLERLALTHKWTLRETDLYTYHVSSPPKKKHLYVVFGLIFLYFIIYKYIY